MRHIAPLPLLSAAPQTSRMAPTSCQEAEEAEEKDLPALSDPPAGPPADHVAPACPQDTKPSFSVNLQVAPESLDPHTLRLLWKQWELEIQALRWAVQNHQDARRCRILQEVAGLPPERSSRSREKILQHQVQKLMLELKEQKEQAQLEEVHLEERLLQAGNTLQQLEAELQAFQKSCLLQLARSSWVGRILRSSTGSVEVVTAETLMDPSDFSESQPAPAAGEGFRLEDVDWNSIAHRYPNLFTDFEFNTDQKHPRAPPPPQLPPATPSDQRSSELCCRRREQRLKSVEWSSPPLGGTSSSGGAGSDSSSCGPAAHYRMQKVTGDPPRAPGHTSEQMEARAQSLCGDSQAPSEGRVPLDLWKTHLDRPRMTVHLSREDPHLQHPRTYPRPVGLKIAAVSRHQRFVRILNQSQEETADLGGFVLQQLVRDVPVCMYRFPPSTLLAPRHHITVWGEAPSNTKQQQRSSLGRRPVHFHSSRSCVTLLLNTQGEVLSQHQAPYSVAPDSRIYADNTDLSIDRCPFSEEAGPGAELTEQQPQLRNARKGRRLEARPRRGRPGCGSRVSQSKRVPQDLTLGKDGRPPPRTVPTSQAPVSSGTTPSRGPTLSFTTRTPHPHPRTRVELPRLSTGQPLRQREVPARPEGVANRPELLPALPETGLGPEDRQPRRERKVRVSAGRRASGRPGPSRSSPGPAPSRPLSGSAPPGVSEARGPRLSHGGAVGAEHGREQVRLPLPQLPAHHRGLSTAGVGPALRAVPVTVAGDAGKKARRQAVPGA
ncbi:lamin tail domain-containing protein 2 isoform X2 [Sus scrofa]|uniref:lamin tail domain-containing protein 2 isoform X2 n=1 Tax=Sus scrofa TaxID=9823 RepID=UPI000A2B28E8|nr:lamin tail domain-containing protein 2 isoform X2 [Sus scrofa]